MKQDLMKFEQLPEERKDALIRAAVEVFGRNDYKGASTDAIARKAGISKGLLFFYFKNKRALYLYLVDYLTEAVIAHVVDEKFYEIDDFFELLEYSAKTKTASFANMPFVVDFSLRAFYSEHKDIKGAMAGWTQTQIDSLFARFFKNVRFEKFREGIDPRKVMDMLVWLTDGYIHQQRSMRKALDMDALMEEYREWFALLKAYAYKEEYQ